MRNYAVLHIAADEARIFVTKERAPLMLCLECYRPEELQLLGNREEKRISSSFSSKRSMRKGSEDMELPLLHKGSVKRSKVDIMKDTLGMK